MHTGRPCRSRTRHGRPCRSAARGSGYCAIHEPGADISFLGGEQTAGQRQYHQRRRSAAESRLALVAVLYEAGAPRSQIAQAVGRPETTINFDCWQLRKEGRIGYRYKRIDINHETAQEVQELWKRGATGPELAARFGWSETHMRSVIYRLRQEGYDLPRRAIGRGELRALIAAQEDDSRREELGFARSSEKGHWADKSIDAPLTADGFTILDTLGAEDENFAELAA